MPVIEYFFSAHSAFAYLGSARLYEIADAAGATVVHKPMDLHAVMAAIGAPGFAERTAEHKKYYFKREIDRWAEYRNAPVLGYRPTHHDNPYHLANCALIVADRQDLDTRNLAHAMLEGHWRFDADVDDRDTLTALITKAGLDAKALLHGAASDEITAIYKANTEEAIRRSVFGSPTYFVDGDMFYGQDRLEMVERALKKPFTGEWPPA